jgi:hypothetical protein
MFAKSSEAMVVVVVVVVNGEGRRIEDKVRKLCQADECGRK